MRSHGRARSGFNRQTLWKPPRKRAASHVPLPAQAPIRAHKAACECRRFVELGVHQTQWCWHRGVTYIGGDRLLHTGKRRIVILKGRWPGQLSSREQREVEKVFRVFGDALKRAVRHADDVWQKAHGRPLRAKAAAGRRSGEVRKAGTAQIIAAIRVAEASGIPSHRIAGEVARRLGCSTRSWTRRCARLRRSPLRTRVVQPTQSRNYLRETGMRPPTESAGIPADVLFERDLNVAFVTDDRTVRLIFLPRDDGSPSGSCRPSWASTPHRLAPHRAPPATLTTPQSTARAQRADCPCRRLVELGVDEWRLCWHKNLSYIHGGRLRHTGKRLILTWQGRWQGELSPQEQQEAARFFRAVGKGFRRFARLADDTWEQIHRRPPRAKSAAGRRSGEVRRAGADRIAAAIQHARASGTSPRRIASVVATRVGVSTRRVRQVLAAEPSQRGNERAEGGLLPARMDEGAVFHCPREADPMRPTPLPAELPR